ncbi:hypothetical protein BKA64DRAFT_757546 [Cadophora sp. MPI-SDFR-AT-0126]|nr:hypothetical protein BKA64DRAFT_757546 [Leotiomycetes sp. MPI-SDFR-AT-0126]
MASQETPNQCSAAELPGSPVSWWSDAIFVGVPRPVRAIKIGVAADRGWKRTVRLSLVQNGETYPPVIIVILQSDLHIKLADLGPVDFQSKLPPSVALEFEFDHPEDDEPGKPRIVLIEQPPIFMVRLSATRLISHDPDQSLMLSKGNELKVRVRESYLPFMREKTSPGPFPIDIDYSKADFWKKDANEHNCIPFSGEKASQ